MGNGDTQQLGLVLTIVLLVGSAIGSSGCLLVSKTNTKLDILSSDCSGYVFLANVLMACWVRDTDLTKYICLISNDRATSTESTRRCHHPQNVVFKILRLAICPVYELAV